jgi:hypothetical protein
MDSKQADILENQWFRQHERQLLEKVRLDQEQRLKTYREEHAQAEREKLRQAHWMKCPKCGSDMKEEHLEGIEVDRCTLCNGLYFDHGELETLLMGKQEGRFKFYRRLFGLD